MTLGGDGTVSGSELGGSKLPVGAATTKNVTLQDTAAAAAAAQTPTGQAITAAKADGFRVWIDTELADDWKAGTATFAAAVKRIGALAARPEVAGIRFTSQLGYNKNFKTAEEINTFVTAASTALRQAAPGKRLGVHTVVPEFACGANDACKTEMRKQYPLLVPEQMEASLTAGRHRPDLPGHRPAVRRLHHLEDQRRAGPAQPVDPGPRPARGTSWPRSPPRRPASSVRSPPSRSPPGCPRPSWTVPLSR